MKNNKLEQSKADKCIIWGIGIDYENIINQIRLEILKGSIEVVAVVSDVDSKYFRMKDGFSIITKEKLCQIKFDFLIIASRKFLKEITNEALLLGIEERKIINGQMFHFSMFDWKRYISLVKEPVTILSDDCWGGYVYHDLFLPFTSPCINISWPLDYYLKFAQDPLYYLDQPLEMERDGDLMKNQCPIGRIGCGDKEIKMKFVHVTDFATAKELWDKRKSRINRNRFFVKFGLPACGDNCELLLEEFNKIQSPKICFYSGKTSISNVLYLPRFEWFVQQGERVETIIFSDYIRLRRDLLYRDNVIDFRQNR